MTPEEDIAYAESYDAENELAKKLEEHLLHCPFCGNGNSMPGFWYQETGRPVWRVGCGACGTSAGIKPGGKPLDAFRQWNTRDNIYKGPTNGNV